MGPSAGSPSYLKESKYTYGTPQTTIGKTTTSLAVEMRTDDDDTAKSWHKHCRIYDGRGRIVQEYSDTERGQLVVNRRFDGRGLLVSESAPRKESCLAGSFAERVWRKDRDFKSSRTYDTLRRPVLVTLPDGETTEHRYAGWSRSLVDQNDHLKRWDSDGLGRMIKVSEYTGSDPTVALYAETNYEYGVADELTKVTDAANNLTTISYDELGRKTSMSDPDMGSWSYSYDAVGNLIEQTDAKSQVIDFTYDKLNRLVRKWYPPAWNAEPGSSGASRSTVFDLIELRAAVDADRAAAGLSAAGWTDPEPSSFRGSYIKDLISAIQDLWTAGLPRLRSPPHQRQFRLLHRSIPLLALRLRLGQHQLRDQLPGPSLAEPAPSTSMTEPPPARADAPLCGTPPATPPGPTMSMAGRPRRPASSTAGPMHPTTPSMLWIGSAR